MKKAPALSARRDTTSLSSVPAFVKRQIAMPVACQAAAGFTGEAWDAAATRQMPVAGAFVHGRMPVGVGGARLACFSLPWWLLPRLRQARGHRGPGDRRAVRRHLSGSDFRSVRGSKRNPRPWYREISRFRRPGACRFTVTEMIQVKDADRTQPLRPLRPVRLGGQSQRQEERRRATSQLSPCK